MSNTNANTDSPDLASVKIRLPATNLVFERFLAYDYHEDFLTPSDAFWFDVDADELSDDEKAALLPKVQVIVEVAGQPQMTGYIDDIDDGRSFINDSATTQIYSL